jgi:hypothetical protein
MESQASDRGNLVSSNALVRRANRVIAPDRRVARTARKVRANRARAARTRKPERLRNHLKRAQPMNRSRRVQVEVARDKMMRNKMMRNEVDRRDQKGRKVPASPVRASLVMEKALRIMNRRMGSLRTDNHKKVSRRMENLKVEVPHRASRRMVRLKESLSKKMERCLSLVSRRRISPAATELASVVSRL